MRGSPVQCEFAPRATARSGKAIGLIFGSILGLLSSSAVADNWTQWRGPTATGVAAPGSYPVSFSDSANVAWKVVLPSRASSTPAVWQDHIFVTGAIEQRDGLLCFDRKGTERWRVPFGPAVEGKHRNASGANSSPVTDGARVYVYFKSGTIAALDFGGTIVWQDNLQERFGKDTLWWDLGTSPVLAAGNLVVAVMQSGNSFLVALNAATGEIAWKERRDFTCPRESDQSYTTPSVITRNGAERIIVWGADRLTAHDAASGKTLWVCDGFNPDQKGMWRTISSVSLWNETAVLSYGRGHYLCGIDLRDGLEPSQRWLWNREDIGADVPTPVTHDGRAYLLADDGQLTCLDIRTGKDLWRSDAARGKGRCFASPILAGDTLYCTSERGDVVVGRLADCFASAVTNRLNENVIATPVPVDNQLLIRGETHLFCLGK